MSQSTNQNAELAQHRPLWASEGLISLQNLGKQNIHNFIFVRDKILINSESIALVILNRTIRRFWYQQL
jgi:hypothetical protein